MNLSSVPQVFLRQRRELAELFGWESRNKYEILGPAQELLGYAAEKRRGLIDLLFRQHFGHWRSFTIQLLNADRTPAYTARHPFRFFFQRLEITNADGGAIGAVQQRFAVFSKRFDVLDATGRLLLEVSSPIWRLWTFPFVSTGRERAVVSKRWSGIFSEMFTDRDTFAVNFTDLALSENERRLVVAAALFIDLMYFEKKA